MILKKPYAFIIKHFRAIHLFLLLPMLFLIMETKDIVVFFSDYIANGYMLSSNYVLSNLASGYINIFMYLAVIIILIVNIFLSIVLQRKEKPTKYYNISIVYYIIIFLLLTASFSIFKMIEADTLGDVLARLIRDLCYIVHYSQYFFVIFTITRGIGFNIKKFNFKSDLQNLEISSEDSEEFEFLVGVDTYKTKRTVRRFFRELKYYYKENKFIFTIIITILVIALGTFIYMNREVYQKEYKEQEIVAFGYLTFNIKDSFISNLSLNGKVINEDKTYLILQIELNNQYREDKEFNYNDLQLVVNKQYIEPNISAGNYFSDFGNPYNGGLIKGITSQTYILVYELDKYLANNKMYISAYSGYDSAPGGVGIISKKINIKPTVISGKVSSNGVFAGTNITFQNTNVGNTKVNISGYELTNRFVYSYEYCYTKDDCYQLNNTVDYDENKKQLIMASKTLLVLDYDLELDSASTYMYTNKSYKTFFEDFMTIKYTLNDTEKTKTVKLSNPNNYSDKLLIAVPNEITYANSIEAIITVRNSSYSIKLK